MDKAKAERKTEKKASVRRTSIGGQAVIEGVMMKGARSIATAVRTESGEITVESKYVKSTKEKNVFFRLPFVRGVINLFSQLFQGTGILLRSAEVYGDFEEPTKTQTKAASKLKVDPMKIVMGVSVVVGILLAVGLFVFLPNFLTGLIFDIPALLGAHPAYQSLMEGALMLIIFVAYILVISLMKDIRRVFMYHGAEHKVISCYEHGLELTVENAKKMSREHSRCGTTFMFFVIAVSILAFAFVNWGLDALGWLTDNSLINALIKFPCKLVFLPVVAGISYELLKLLAKSDNLFVRILRSPGMLLQKLTTKEPTEDMLEVSITAFKTVMEMDENPNLPERKFEINIPYGKARERIAEIAKDADESDIDWILVEATGRKRAELHSDLKLSGDEYKCALAVARKMEDGTPLCYALGNAEFYGIKFAVDKNVLIPRPETETLVEKAVELVNGIAVDLIHSGAGRVIPRVLDMCTGSGAIAVSVCKNAAADMTAADVSAAAVAVAEANALNNGVKINFIKSDMFSDINGKFDLILCNPPYIPTADLKGLDKRVKDFEPMIALDGGSDGLDFYRIIAKDGMKRLEEGGRILTEFGIGQSEDIEKIFKNYKTEIIKDLEGVDRIALITTK